MTITLEITNTLNRLEASKKIKVLYACEAGSRAFGFASKQSDYDVRFIYVHNLDWYLGIENNKEDVIEALVDNTMDIVGWDLKKTFFLLSKSNPRLIEYLFSPIVYQKNTVFLNEMQEIATSCYSPQANMYHYLNIATDNYENYLCENKKASSKKYIHAIRAILCCQWITTNHTMPPISIDALLTNTSLPPAVKDRFLTLLEKKKRERKDDFIDEVLNTYIKEQINVFDFLLETILSSTIDKEKLNSKFIFLLKIFDKLFT